ncbi:hypothetical protein V6N13_017231 [Hibiscus sabdariffa]|uniref:Uncharacterized protein n=1 Tax=Hibiscus sabdariffa TaxID=183260 RepID=A0ABR2CZ24_9ROSI
MCSAIIPVSIENQESTKGKLSVFNAPVRALLARRKKMALYSQLIPWKERRLFNLTAASRTSLLLEETREVVLLMMKDLLTLTPISAVD